MSSKSTQYSLQKIGPIQRKTTPQWWVEGELSAVDIARVLEKLSNPGLTECWIEDSQQRQDKMNIHS